jgi:hypothetical protein
MQKQVSRHCKVTGSNFGIKQVKVQFKVLRVQMKSEEYAFTCDMGEESYALRVVLSGHFICMTATQY